MMNQMATNGNRYYMGETKKFGEQVAAHHDLKSDYVTLYAGSSEILTFTPLAGSHFACEISGHSRSLLRANLARGRVQSSQGAQGPGEVGL
jgi:hypothetical protein